MKLNQVEPRFLEFIPDVLEEGLIYISIPYGAVIHLCCCGCGEKVATPLSPTQWCLAYDGKRISLWPSIGSFSLPCSSHYVIERNEVRWAGASMPLDGYTSPLSRHAGVDPHYPVHAAFGPYGWWRRIRASLIRRCQPWTRSGPGR